MPILAFELPTLGAFLCLKTTPKVDRVFLVCFKDSGAQSKIGRIGSSDRTAIAILKSCVVLDQGMIESGFGIQHPGGQDSGHLCTGGIGSAVYIRCTLFCLIVGGDQLSALVIEQYFPIPALGNGAFVQDTDRVRECAPYGDGLGFRGKIPTC